MTDLKLVKMAILSSQNEIIKIVHYKTKIVEFNTKSGICKVIKSLSPASDRQIKNFIEVFNPKTIIDLNKNYVLYEKNAFSEPITY